MKIGITERGDAGIDLSWEKKIEQVDGVILITKNITEEFRNAAIRNKEKVIVHATCTGYGGTILEPNVPEYQEQINSIKQLVNDGFPIEQIVLRVDPIIPTVEGLETAAKVINRAREDVPGISRVRFSLIDMYPHVRERFQKQNIPLPYGDNFYPGREDVQRVNEWLQEQKKMHPIHFEACAENVDAEQVGCVSNRDIQIFGLEMQEEIGGYQRKGCLCLSCKTELLSEKKQCPHQCLYCYWKG